MGSGGLVGIWYRKRGGGEETSKQEGQLQGRDGAWQSSVSGKGNASGLGVGVSDHGTV